MSSKRPVLALFFGLLLAFPGFARDVVITVEDEDLEIPLEGATIRSWDGTLSYCDQYGRAVIAVPDDRQVIIQIAYPGYENRRLAIPPVGEAFTATLRLGGIMESQELVLEVQRPGTSETRSGRSVAISDRELSRTAEIGIVEDVMTSVKLLPGVGYTSMFNARPSIRGGDPGDMIAVLDGFYINEPYHWAGAYSIFDPRMVASARLSHGVFSARYGMTISGLLEVSSKKPSSTGAEIDVGISTSATELILSYPIANRGGIMAMGRVTYWDPMVFAAQGLSTVVDNENLDMINSISTAPYIRSAALAGDYQVAYDLDVSINSYFASDGVGLTYKNTYNETELSGSNKIEGDYNNYLAFLIGGVTWTPSPKFLLKGSAGFGYRQMDIGGHSQSSLTASYSPGFIATYGQYLNGETTYTTPDTGIQATSRNMILDTQGRIDFDWEIGNGFLAAFGFHENYSQWRMHESVDLFVQQSIASLNSKGVIINVPIAAAPDAAIIYPWTYTVDVFNQGLSTAAYALGEYKSPNQKFGAELGLRMDHIYFIGKDFAIQTMPVFNPRLNLDFTILKDYSFIDSLSITAGTGLFSAMNETVIFIEGRNNIRDFDMRPNRSWTSVVGIKMDFLSGYSVNLEGYAKQIFDRAYITANPGVDSAAADATTVNYRFDGKGMIFGFDLQLQKFESRYWDGWITYTFTYARYNDPHGGGMGVNMGGIYGEENWYYPSFHRFHNINLVFNAKPRREFNIAGRLGFASGRLKSKVGEITFYPVQQIDEFGQPVGPVIQRYNRESEYDDDERTTWSIPCDLKFSFYLFNRRNKVQTEMYLGVENLLSLVYQSEANTSYNTYTGREDQGSNSASYEMPIPMVSFGFRWSF